MIKWSAWLIVLLLASAASVTGAGSGPRDKAHEDHARALRIKLKDRGFTVLTEPPFVVVGDESEAQVTEWAHGIVRGTVQRLKQDFFSKDPSKILEIWLFRDEASYRKHAKEFFDHEPSTPYGYYSPAKRALVMNIATGGGTLVHEIVHPFMEANFPAAPAWFNEGMGSLYEQSGVVDGRIYGYPNWRLAGLQKAITKRQVPTFKLLTHLSDDEFYRERSGTNYAQARYLCYYLQEKRLLTKFYKAFAANSSTDPTGYKTLQNVLGERDMAAFQRKWEAFVMRLTF